MEAPQRGLRRRVCFECAVRFAIGAVTLVKPPLLFASTTQWALFPPRNHRTQSSGFTYSASTRHSHVITRNHTSTKLSCLLPPLHPRSAPLSSASSPLSPPPVFRVDNSIRHEDSLLSNHQSALSMITSSAVAASPATEEVKALFGYPCDSFIARSALEGHMGHVTVVGDSGSHTLAARIDLGVFSLLGGCPNEELTRGATRSVIVVPAQPAWVPVIEACLPTHTPYTRHTMEADLDSFDLQQLQRCVESCPPAYTIVPITQSLAEQALQHDWSVDLCGNFGDATDFVERGVGFAAVEVATGTIAAGASSFAVCDAGIEVEVDTAPSHQRRGLAVACAARLLLECVRRRRQPSWDAHVLASVHIAKKLGYTTGTAYTAFSSDPPS